MVESTDGGKTWSKPVVIAENDDRLNPQGIGEECDFVELDDTRDVDLAEIVIHTLAFFGD